MATARKSAATARLRHRSIALREAVPTVEEAEAEAARLNALNETKGAFYFAAPVKWFAGGREVEVGY